MKKNLNETKRTLFQNIKDAFKKLYQIDKTTIWFLALSVVFSAISPFIFVLFPKFLLDELSSPQRNITIVILLIVGTALFSFFINSATALLNWSITPKMERFRNYLKIELGQKIASLDQQDLETPNVLDLNQRAQSALEDGQGVWVLIYGVIYFFEKLFVLVGCISIIFTLNWLFIVILILPVLVGILAEYFWEKSNKKIQNILQPIWRKLIYLMNILTQFQYGKDIRLYNMRQWLLEKYHDMSLLEYHSLKRLWRNNFKNRFGWNLSTFITTAATYIYLTYSVLHQGISIGDFLMYSSAILTFVNSATDFLNLSNYVIAENRYVNDYHLFMQFHQNHPQTQKFNQTGSPINIEFKNVSFKYPNQDQYALKNVSLTIHDHEKLAVVGLNGAGKTTFIKLLTRLYEPTEGEILLNGKNIAFYDKEEYYQLFSVVFQDINLFSFSIKENVAMVEKEDIDENKVWDCLKKAGLEEKVSSLKQGMDTNLQKNLDENGIMLSGGEAQKLVFARALYKDAPFCILDEPTSALDALAELRLYQQFNTILKDKTAIYISHRLSSTRFCDRIVLFKEGKILEMGTHDELIQTNQEYSQLFAMQANYYMNEGGEN